MSHVPLHLRLAYHGGCFSDPYSSPRRSRPCWPPLASPAAHAPAKGDSVRDADVGVGWFSSVLMASAVASAGRMVAQSRGRCEGGKRQRVKAGEPNAAPCRQDEGKRTPTPPATPQDTVKPSGTAPPPPTTASEPAQRRRQPRRQKPTSSSSSSSSPPLSPSPSPSPSSSAALSDWAAAPPPPDTKRDTSDSEPTTQDKGTGREVPPPQRVKVVYDLPADHPDAAALNATREPVSPWATRPATAATIAVATEPPPEEAGNDKDKDSKEGDVRNGVESGKKALERYDDVDGTAALAAVVDQLYDKIRLNAVKVVSLDDLNQQLIETFKIGQAARPQTGTATTTTAATRLEREELALHLYDLRAQVQKMQNLLDEREREQRRELAKLAAANSTAARQQASPITVEIVRLSEEEPIPYPKPPYQKARRWECEEPPAQSSASAASVTTSTAKTADLSSRRKHSKGGKRREAPRHSPSEGTSVAKAKGRGSRRHPHDESIEEEVEEEASVAAFSSIQRSSDPVSLTSTSSDGSSSSSSTVTTDAVGSARSSTGQSSKTRKTRGRQTPKESVPPASSRTPSSASPSPAEESEGDAPRSGSDSSTGDLFWKRRAAAAAAARQARQPQSRRSSSLTTTTTDTSTTTSPTSTESGSSSSSRSRSSHSTSSS